MLPPGLLERPRSTSGSSACRRCARRLHAASGFGKTTLAAQWGAAFDGRIAGSSCMPATTWGCSSVAT